MIPQAVSLGVSLLPSLYKGISSIVQGNRANKINPVDPQYQMNSGVIDNARRLEERASNYEMPGFGRAMNNINTTYSGAFAIGEQGASSGGDVLDLATKIAYGQASAQNDLNARNAQGRDNAYMQSLDANAKAGQEYQNKNAYDREIYQQQLREKAALTQSANENAYGAINDASVAGMTMINGINGQRTPQPWNINTSTAPVGAQMSQADYEASLRRQYV